MEVLVSAAEVRTAKVAVAVAGMMVSSNAVCTPYGETLIMKEDPSLVLDREYGSTIPM